MTSEAKGASAVIKGPQPMANSIHWRNHLINLAIAFECKNETVSKFMDDLTSVFYFFSNSLKRQQFFEWFVNFCKDDMSVSKSDRKHVIGLAKTRRVERHKAYDNYYILYKFIIPIFESICRKSIYEDFYEHLEREIKETWSSDKETVSKAQGLYAFSVLFNWLDPLKPLVTKLQKRIQDIYQAYHMIKQVLKGLEKIKSNITEEFKLWFQFSFDMAVSVGVSPSIPQIAKCWSQFRNNMSSEDNESYYRQATGVPVINVLITNLDDRIADKNHTELFSLLSTVYLPPQVNFENSVICLLQSFVTGLLSGKTPIIFQSEMKRWISYFQRFKKRRTTIKNHKEKKES